MSLLLGAGVVLACAGAVFALCYFVGKAFLAYFGRLFS